MIFKFSDDFATDPIARGWYKAGTKLDWSLTREAIGGDFDRNWPSPEFRDRYLKALDREYTQDDHLALLAKIYWNGAYGADQPNSQAYIGFFKTFPIGTVNVNSLQLKLGLRSYPATPPPNHGTFVRLCEDDGTTHITPVPSQILEQANIPVKFWALMIYDPDDGELTLVLFDERGTRVTESHVISIPDVSFSVNEIGIRNQDTGSSTDNYVQAWVEDLRWLHTFAFEDISNLNFEELARLNWELGG